MATTGQLVINDPNRHVVGIVATRPRQVIEKKVSLYDFGPTILDLLGIDIEPEFPFGKSIFAKESGTIPDVAQLQYLYDFFKREMSWRDEGYCNESHGFCWERGDGGKRRSW
jgi:arylsulfatase A-like enzyme